MSDFRKRTVSKDTFDAELHGKPAAKRHQKPFASPESAALGCARPPARVSKNEAVTAGFRRKKQYHLEVETTLLAIYLTVGFRRKKQYHLEVEPTLWRLQMNYIETTML